MKLALIILAAGNSSRLGQPKQLLRRGNQSMIEYITTECIESDLGPLYIITGKYHDEISKALESKSSDTVHILQNKNWNDGMSSSIAFAIKSINQKSIDGVIIVLSDQVYFDANILIEIAKVAQSSQHKIINCKYAKGMGPPTYFSKSVFSELEKLTGDHGAKTIVQMYTENSSCINFFKGHIDLDIQSDLDILTQF